MDAANVLEGEKIHDKHNGERLVTYVISESEGLVNTVLCSSKKS